MKRLDPDALDGMFDEAEATGVVGPVRAVAPTVSPGRPATPVGTRGATAVAVAVVLVVAGGLGWRRSAPGSSLEAAAQPSSGAPSPVVPLGAPAASRSPVGVETKAQAGPTRRDAVAGTDLPSVGPSPGRPPGGAWVIRFPFGRADGAEVTPVAAAAAACPGMIEVRGFTCDLGDPAFNEALAVQRAEAVAAAVRAAGGREVVVRPGGVLGADAPGPRAARRRVEINCVQPGEVRDGDSDSE